ncbi:MAG: RNA-splicing ligase RtcB [Cyanobacteria bacterium]|nr:RNA-splicing ligase RtcB [Cyanobacteria bacterium CG_2015-16_32_12]NCO79584.1 RNA-splicing ligase RtcB [Cyanobacteria bacterium CG_2015-22_32_23]NCQ03537.1 RNA-splicing ligase RtcB [Cyanobacteria bacterium CG_2015-09_32_10]NCQ42663.1 RNA-splicing ligase RtcB [Cyanobacteria bacterium CG_2015-04_32_10]NCS85509.1 RNA-splicing ligase RtcB [Cyanobacteria bacterium CG_2015-02_32_10]
MPYEQLNLSTPKPVLSWANHDLGFEETAMAKNVASLPFVYKHVALMPDVHLGKGALVGSVIATKDAIIPAAVGVDVGCGMCSLRTSFNASQLEGKLKKIRLEIEANIPVGFNENKDVETKVTNWQGWQGFKDLHSGVQRLEGKAIKQLGSLGGGNHFIELCLDTEDQVWLMLHSGSRHIGNQLADCHIKTGKQLAKLANLRLPDPDLAYFIAGTPEFDAYWRDLQWAQGYARFNRDVMMSRFKAIVEKHLNGGKATKPLLTVNCHHNYAEKETHFGEDVYVTRKGAVRATENDYGIIPGSMGAKSFIVKGKGNHDSFCSCFAGNTQILTEYGLMLIEDVYNSDSPIKLVSYNEKLQKFELTEILEQSCRSEKVNQYSFSQTRRRLNNNLICTANHPFATYEKGEITYQPIEEIFDNKGGVIIPSQISLPSDLSIEDYDPNFYYLLGVILSDGSIYSQERKNAPDLNNRPRNGQYTLNYIRIYQSSDSKKEKFLSHVKKLFDSYDINVSVRTQEPRISKIKGREIQGKPLMELTISDSKFIEKVINIKDNLPQILLTNPYLSLYFLAGYLDGDGSINRDTISISVGKIPMFNPLICALLSLGIAYKVYNNRNNYLIEFRDNLVITKLANICQRLVINEPPKRLYGDKLLLAKSLTGGKLSHPDLNRYGKDDKMINIEKLCDESLDFTLSMNRVVKSDSLSEIPVYNFTVADNHNYIVFTDYYTPILVHNCSHGAGRKMSRSQAKKRFDVHDLVMQTEGIECRKDSGIIDEIPSAYKSIEEVMNQQTDLVEIVATLKQVICVKG